MHILSGMILSFLLSRKQGPKKPPLLNMSWPIQTKHLLPGRVRFCIPLFKGNQSALDGAMIQLKKIDGVISARANAVSGSVLIYFEPHKLQADLLLAALIRLLQLEKEIERTPVAKFNKEIADIFKAFNQAIYGKTNGLLDAKTSIGLIVLAFGIYRIISERTFTMPASLTLIWWAYHTLTKTQDATND